MTMKRYHVDLRDTKAFHDELDELLVTCNGYQWPRFSDVTRGIGGYLGLRGYQGYESKPTFNSYGTGTDLDDTKYYSIRVVPVDSTQAFAATALFGIPSQPSMPKISDTGGTPIVWDIPAYTQWQNHECGLATANGTDECADSTKSWTADEWIGYYVFNPATGVRAEITDNTDTLLTAAGFSITSGEYFCIQSAQCDKFYVYAAEMDAASDILTATFYFQDIIDGPAATQYELATYTALSVTLDDDRIDPPGGAFCVQGGRRMFIGGGIYNDTGKAQVNVTDEDIQATGDANSAIDITVTTDLYTDAGAGRIIRYTLGSALGPLTKAYEGSILTVTSATDSENNVTNAVITRVDPSNMWVEILNNDGVAAASETAVLLNIVQNTVEGNTSGSDATEFSEAMVGGTIGFDDDPDSYVIAGVDVVNQRILLDAAYAGGVTSTDGDFIISTSNDVYYSDVSNPNVFRPANYINISDRPTTAVVNNTNLLVGCERSLHTIDINNLESAPVKLIEDIACNAPHAVADSQYGVLIWTGSGLSLTDGSSVVSVTQEKIPQLMRDVNSAMIHNAHLVFNDIENRFEFAFPYDTDISNNYGLYIHGPTRRVFPTICADVNCLFVDVDSNGRQYIAHGNSDRHTTAGTGIVWSHDPDIYGDYVDSGNTWLLEIASVNTTTNVITATSDIQCTSAAGEYLLHYPAFGRFAYYSQFIIKSITETDTSPYTYEIGYSSDWNDDDFAAGDFLFVGGIPFDYGPKWRDFGGPHHRKQVRRVEIDVEPMSGYVTIDHYYDSDTTPSKTETKAVSPSMTKISFPVNSPRCYKYGFRLRGVASSVVKIHDVVVLFDVHT